MNKIRNAAIIILGLGEKHALDVLKNIQPKDVGKILEEINKLDKISELDVIDALQEFFMQSSTTAGIDDISRDTIKKALMSAVSNSKIGSFSMSNPAWLDVVQSEPLEHVLEIIEKEHPQVITAFIIMLSQNNTEYASDLLKVLPKELQNKIIKKMGTIKPMSSYAVDAMTKFFEAHTKQSARYQVYNMDGVDAVANIINYLDTETEKNIIDDLTSTNKDLAEQVQDKVFPFERLAKIDKKALQALLQEVSSEDLVMALKGCNKSTITTFLGAMSSKSGDILKDDMESKGPVKLGQVVEAQKRIIQQAKKMAEEEKIVLNLKSTSDIVN